MKRNNINIYTICLVLLIMECAYSLITLTLLHGYQTIISIVMFISFFMIYKERRPISKLGIIVYAIVVLGNVISYRGDVWWIVISLLSRLPLLTFFMMKKEDLHNLAKNLDKCFCFIVSVSLGLYVLMKLGVPIPNLGLVTYNQYELVNYFYFYTDSVAYENKFTGFSLEVGYFALACICMICLNRFDFRKKSTVVYTLAVLFSMSLEGYLLLAVGYISSSICKDASIRSLLKYTITACIVIGVFLYLALNINGGDNIIAENIMERLVFDEELGIAGNNRENIVAKPILDSIFYSDKVWLGVGAIEFRKSINVDGIDLCSWRVFVCVYGVFYTILLAITTLIGLRKTMIKETLPFFIIFWLDFYPHGGPFTEVLYFMIIIFLLYPKYSIEYETNEVRYA